MTETTAPPLPRRFGRKHKTTFWGREYTVKPAVANGHLGDGRLLLGFQTLNDRPNYYLIRVDSGFFNLPDADGYDGVNDVIDALSDDFGERESKREHLEDDLRDQGIEPTGENTDLDGNEDRLGWPVLALDCGYHWWTEAVFDGKRWREPKQS